MDRFRLTASRRRFLAGCAGLGFSGSAATLLWSCGRRAGEISSAALATALEVSGLEFTEAERELMLGDVNDLLAKYRTLRAVSLDNGVPPAFRFDPETAGGGPADRPVRRQAAAAEAATAPTALPDPDDPEALAFATVPQLAALLRGRKVTSRALTRLYLDRLERFGPLLECVVTLTPELALEQAERADRELAAGRFRGPLHGIPWGAKDLLSARGYPTTWGATPYRDQVLDVDATVVRRLEEAGAVLVAKLALGALAWGDVWFGGKTRNPWNPEQGSSGSSAGPAAATAAGLVGFSVGSETWGSIISPSSRCGVTGLRPTFGRVSRHGAMALSWTMDKLGPICRSVAGCALVLQAIHGADGRDRTAVDRPFAWPPPRRLRALRIGYVKALFEEAPGEGREVWRRHERAALERLRELGVELLPIELPSQPVEALSFILSAEAAAAFDELTRSGRDDLLVRQVADAWPNVFREARTIPAVEYIQANRVRTLLLEAMEHLFEAVDVYVAPSFGGNNLLLTNLTGHPAVVLPNGFTEAGQPTSLSFVGRLYGESDLLAAARDYQEATGFHRRHPRLEAEAS